MRGNGLYFSNGLSKNGLKTRDKITLSSKATEIYDSTDQLFEAARKLGEAKLDPQTMETLDKKIAAKLSEVLYRLPIQHPAKNPRPHQ